MKRRISSLFVVVLVFGCLTGCESNVQNPPVDPGKTKASAPKAEAPKVDADIFKVEWVKVESPTEMEKGKEHTFPLTLKNTSDGVWSSQGADKKAANQVAICYHWLPAVENKLLDNYDGIRTFLTKDVAPGETLSADVKVLAPADAGEYRLQLTLVQENVGWFESKGAKTEVKSVLVR